MGQAVKGGALTLAEGSPVLAGQLSPSNAREVRPGMRVLITEPGTGATVPGRVVSVSHETASKASISGGLYVAMRVRTRRPLPLSLVGQDVSMTIAAARTPGPVLAVPEAAIFAGADGQTYVSKLAGGHLVRVAVRVGMSGTGLVQVTPAKPGALTPGEQVVTGQNYAGSAPVGRPVVGRSGPGGVSSRSSGRSGAADDDRGDDGRGRGRRAGHRAGRGRLHLPRPAAGPRRSSRPTWSSSAASTWPSWARRGRASRRC